MILPSSSPLLFHWYLAGCGNGKYLHINRDVFKLGCDVCRPLVDFAWSQGHEVQVCDGLHLPYRDGCFDAVLSIAGNGQSCTHEGAFSAVDLSHFARSNSFNMHETAAAAT